MSKEVCGGDFGGFWEGGRRVRPITSVYSRQDGTIVTHQNQGLG